MEEKLIAPCGMNCAVCIAYIGRTIDLNSKGFHRKYCEGCLPRGKNCLHMGDECTKLDQGLVRFCFECEDYPCKRLKGLDKRYRTKYHLSMIENLETIKAHGMADFLDKQKEIWRCKSCGSTICCHNGLCLNCELDMLRQNKTYRWGER
jgi:hypothetical protein